MTAKGGTAFATSTGKLTTAGRVAQGVIGYGGSVVASAAVGRDAHFSWNAVAASVVGSYASAKLGGKVPFLEGGDVEGNFGTNLIGTFVNGAVNESAERLMGLGNQDWTQVAEDAFGNAFANVAIQGIESSIAKRQQTKQVDTQAEVISAQLQQKAQRDGVDLKAMKPAEFEAYVKGWLNSVEEQHPTGDSSAAGDETPEDGVANRSYSRNGVAAGFDPANDHLISNSLLLVDGSPISKLKFTGGMLVGVLGAAWDDVGSLADAAKSIESAKQDVLEIIAHKASFGALVSDAAYNDAISRTADRAQALNYIANNLPSIIKNGLGEEWAGLKRDFNYGLKSLAEGNYFDAGVATGKLAYKVIPLLLGVGAVARAGISIGARIAEVGVTGALREAAAVVAARVRNIRSPAREAAEPVTVDLHLKYKEGWTDVQRAQADAKVKFLNDSDTVVTEVNRSGTSASRRYRQSGGTVPAGYDVDHMRDLQLGGEDAVWNMQTLDSSVNRSLGAQIRWKINGLAPGTVINRVSIGD